MLLMLEVMDREPSLRVVWGAALLLGFIGLIATRVRRWLVLPALALVAIAAWHQVSEFLDPQVGPAIMREAGLGYLIQSCAAISVAVILSLLGLLPKRAV